MVRFTPVLMLPALILTGRIRLSIGFFLGSLVTLILSGPWSSWEFLTQVLPAMSDVSGMRRCPALHVLVLCLLDSLPISDWAGYFPALATLVTGILYGCLLAVFFLSRKELSTESIVLLACFLPPLFAGKNDHHYTLAIFPVMAGMAVYVRDWMAELTPKEPEPSEEDHITQRRSRSELAFLYLWPVVLIPSFYYWYPCKTVSDIIAWIGPFDTHGLLTLSSTAAFALLFQRMRKNGEALI